MQDLVLLYDRLFKEAPKRRSDIASVMSRPVPTNRRKSGKRSLARGTQGALPIRAMGPPAQLNLNSAQFVYFAAIGSTRAQLQWTVAFTSKPRAASFVNRSRPAVARRLGCFSPLRRAPRDVRILRTHRVRVETSCLER